MKRLSACGDRLDDYLAGKISGIEELEEDVLPFTSAGSLQHNFYRCLATPSEL